MLKKRFNRARELILQGNSIIAGPVKREITIRKMPDLKLEESSIRSESVSLKDVAVSEQGFETHHVSIRSRDIHETLKNDESRTVADLE